MSGNLDFRNACFVINVYHSLQCAGLVEILRVFSIQSSGEYWFEIEIKGLYL